MVSPSWRRLESGELGAGGLVWFCVGMRQKNLSSTAPRAYRMQSKINANACVIQYESMAQRKRDRNAWLTFGSSHPGVSRNKPNISRAASTLRFKAASTARSSVSGTGVPAHSPARGALFRLRRYQRMEVNGISDRLSCALG
ncbi:hypothetical protein KL918_004148 [Ogataea parapolymorpha]|nr:hypothetical protein KL918_004148 [Ogataea parapolymorpha]KAG7867975.1 hypothetical protein KL916_005345 [Ogataea parapolymorpha]